MAMSVVAPLGCLGLQLALEFRHGRHSRSQWGWHLVQAPTVPLSGHSPLDSCSGHVGLLKAQRLWLSTPSSPGHGSSQAWGPAVPGGAVLPTGPCCGGRRSLLFLHPQQPHSRRALGEPRPRIELWNSLCLHSSSAKAQRCPLGSLKYPLQHPQPLVPLLPPCARCLQGCSSPSLWLPLAAASLFLPSLGFALPGSGRLQAHCSGLFQFTPLVPGSVGGVATATVGADTSRQWLRTSCHTRFGQPVTVPAPAAPWQPGPFPVLWDHHCGPSFPRAPARPLCSPAGPGSPLRHFGASSPAAPLAGPAPSIPAPPTHCPPAPWASPQPPAQFPALLLPLRARLLFPRPACSSRSRLSRCSSSPFPPGQRQAPAARHSRSIIPNTRKEHHRTFSAAKKAPSGHS